MAVKVAVSALNSCEEVIKCALRIIFHKIESERKCSYKSSTTLAFLINSHAVRNQPITPQLQQESMQQQGHCDKKN